MKGKRLLSIILVVAMVLSMGMTSAFAFSSDYVDDAWSYSKTFSSSDSTTTLGEDGFAFAGSSVTLADNGLTLANGSKATFGKNGASMDFDYSFDMYAYKNVNNYSVHFHYTDASNFYTITLRRNEKIVQLTKTIGGKKYVLAQQPFDSKEGANYIGHTYNVSVKNTGAGTVINATVTSSYKPVYEFSYTDTATDKGYDELDNGAPHTAGKIQIEDEWAGTRIEYLNVNEIKKADSWTYAHTFTDADTVDALVNDGYTFSSTPTFNADGMYGGTSATTITFAPKKSTLTDDYSFQTSIYCVTNAHLYAFVKFNKTDAGYYRIKHNRPSTGFADYYIAIEKVVGSTVYTLAKTSYKKNSGLNWCTYDYDIDVGIAGSSVKINAYVKNRNNAQEYTLEAIDTATDKGADGIDNGAPITSGTIEIENLSSSYRVNYLNAQSTPGVYEEAIVPDVPDEPEEPEIPSVPSSALCLVNDRDPYTGVLEAGVGGEEFTFDTLFSSVGLDLGTHDGINNIILTDNDNSNRLHQVDLSLYESDDNVEYSKIRNFTATKIGGKIYIYNFNSTKRYIKVHQHHGEVLTDYLEGKSFINNIDDIIMAQKADLPGAGGGEFTKIKTISITPEIASEDSVAFVPSSLLNDCGTNPLRFVLSNGYVLAHYKTAEGIYVRIPETVANTKISIDVYGNNAHAADLSDMNNVFEVRYGNRTPMFLNSKTEDGVAFNANNSVTKAPNGDYIMIANGGQGSGYLVQRRSTDGGRTWSTPVEIYRTGSMCDGGGFMVDHERGIMWYCGYFKKQSPTIGTKMGFMESRDNGLTWSEPRRITGSVTGAIYSDGIKTKEYDGDGPNIDYVIPSMFGSGEGERIAGNLLRDLTSNFTTGTVFSRDNGRNWQATASRVNFVPEGTQNAFEAGLSETSIAYLSDDSLALISRNQWPTETHYAQSVSYDNGFTWVEQAWRSTVTASNGDPDIMEHKDDIIVLWPGHSTLGGATYTRFPLALAYSTDDMKTWNKKLDIWEGTYFGVYNTEGNDRAYGTQPGFLKMTYKGSEDLYAYWTHHGTGGGSSTSSVDAVLIEDFDDYLYKSKGAADDFEASNNKFESWFQVRGRSFPNASVTISNEQAKTGEKSLKLVANNNCLFVNRSLPQMLNGEISFDFFVDSLGGDCYIGYKDAYNSNPCKSTIYSLKIKKDGKLYALDSSKDSTQTGTAVAELGMGKWNNIKIVFDIKSDVCGLYVNDVKVADLARNKDIPDYDGICFMSIATASSSYSMNAFLDNFIAYEGVSMTAQAN